MTFTFGSDVDDFALALRIPKWAEGATVPVNGGEAVPAEASANRLFTLRRDWRRGDALVLDLPMTLRYVYGRESQRDHVAFLRGPLVFGVGRAANEAAADRRQVLGEWTVDPSTAVVERDDTVRPGGVRFTVEAQAPDGKVHPLVFTEFADPTLVETYFRLKGFREDELFDRPLRRWVEYDDGASRNSFCCVGRRWCAIGGRRFRPCEVVWGLSPSCCAIAFVLLQ